MDPFRLPQDFTIHTLLQVLLAQAEHFQLQSLKNLVLAEQPKYWNYLPPTLPPTPVMSVHSSPTFSPHPPPQSKSVSTANFSLPINPE